MIKRLFVNPDSTIQRRPYIAPEVFVDYYVEEREMLAATPVTGSDPNSGNGGGDDVPLPPGVPPAAGAKDNDLFFDDRGIDW